MVLTKTRLEQSTLGVMEEVQQQLTEGRVLGYLKLSWIL